MIAADFRLWLIDNGFGNDSNVFENFQPDSPDNCISIYDVNAANISESSSLSVDQFAIQLIVRNSVTTNANNKLRSIHNSFVGFSGNLHNNTTDFISMVFIDTQPYSIGKDENGRHEYTVTYSMRVQSKNNIYRL